jgi:hypothetical protein
MGGLGTLSNAQRSYANAGMAQSATKCAAKSAGAEYG